MKKLLLIIFGIILASSLLYYYQYRSSAQSTPLMLAKITYNNDAEFEQAWNGSTSVHYFYEQQATVGSYMISRLTRVQYDRLIAQGFKGEVVDENPNMSLYMVVYSPQVEPGRDPVQSFAQIGEAEALDTRFTLVRADTAAKKLDHDSLIEDSIPVFPYDIEKPLTKPKYKTVRAKN